MAGLYTNIVTSRNKAFPPFPRIDGSVGVYSSMAQGYNSYYYYPAFSGGTAGRAIRIRHSANLSTENLYLYNLDGTTVTDGVWDGGMTPAEGGGNGAVDCYLQYYMDEADNKLYMLTADTGTTPYTFYLSSVNEAGTVTAIGSAQVGNATMNNPTPRGGYSGPMHRAGGDGSGNFQIHTFGTAGGSSAAAIPFRGALMTINITNGALSYADLLPSTFSHAYYHGYGFGTVGTTDNNILLQPYYNYSASDRVAGHYANIYNLSNGKSVFYVTFPGDDGGVFWGSSFSMTQRWREKYYFPNYAVPYGKAMGAYSEADMNNWADQIAVYYGIL